MARLAAFDGWHVINADHHLGRNVATLARLRERDITLTFATGRRNGRKCGIFWGALLDAYLITGNGTRIHSLEGDVLHRQDLPILPGCRYGDAPFGIPEPSMHVFNDNGWFTGGDPRAPPGARLQRLSLSGYRYKSVPNPSGDEDLFAAIMTITIRLRIQLNEGAGDALLFSAVRAAVPLVQPRIGAGGDEQPFRAFTGVAWRLATR